MPGDQCKITAAVLQIPCGLFVLTSTFDGARSGVLTRWVQPCSINPPHVMVAVAKGVSVEPLIRDSRAFALSQISAGDRLLLRVFGTPPRGGEDPFVTLPSHPAASGSPIIDRALSYLDCKLVCHVDLDADHRLFVGEIEDGEIINPGHQPAVVVGANGQVDPPFAPTGPPTGA